MKQSVITLIGLYVCIGFIFSSCANIIPPGGGPIDSLPPMLVNANPKDSSRNFSTNKIVLTFNEFVDLDNPFENVVMSPLTQNQPTIERKLRTVTIRFRDSLEANTTYTINFGNTIKDVNEGNVAKNFSYVFSTGNVIDENKLSGRVWLAETGKTDSTLVAILHNNLSDTAVMKLRPRYMAKLKGDGSFTFNNIAAGKYRVYVVPNDFTKRYDDSTKTFAFHDSVITISKTTDPVVLYAFQAFKKQEKTSNSNQNKKAPPPAKNITYQNNLVGSRLGLLDTLSFVFASNVTIDTNKIVVSDTNYKKVESRYFVDSNAVKILFARPETTPYRLVLQKDAVKDTAGKTLAKTDTLRFSTRSEQEYGSIKIRFRNVDYSRNPVLIFMQNGTIKDQINITQAEWYRKLYPPGQYELKILYDANKNGVWDTGLFTKTQKRQPEIIRDLKKMLTIRGNWDNELDISF